MSHEGYRTLMLEPQWHPLRWAKDHEDVVFGFLVVWDIFAPMIVAVVPPRHMGSWPWWRWTLFGLGFSPLGFVLLIFLGLLLFGVGQGFRWLYQHPPVKVKTRYVSK